MEDRGGVGVGSAADAQEAHERLPRRGISQMSGLLVRQRDKSFAGLDAAGLPRRVECVWVPGSEAREGEMNFARIGRSGERAVNPTAVIVVVPSSPGRIAGPEGDSS